MNDFKFFLREGFFHIFNWEGYDHLLFLIALVVLFKFVDFKKMIGLVTLFTVGHTLSLFLATFKVVEVNSLWVEFLIPVTILITAISNIIAVKYKKTYSIHTHMFFALIFGFIHGLGFLNYFQILIGQTNRAISLLEFSLGIELAQIGIMIIALSLGYIIVNLLKFSRKEWILIASSIVIGAVIPALIESTSALWTSN